MKRILAVHLLNDRSGSPFVFRQAIEVLVKQGYDIHLCTSGIHEDGFLSKIEGITYHEVRYHWSENKYRTLLNFFQAQFRIFLITLRLGQSLNFVYINSVLPFGAALGGWLLRKKVIYHVHEVSIKPALLKRFLSFIVNLTSSCNIYVSNFVNITCEHKTHTKKVIYNCVPEEFLEMAELYSQLHPKPAKHKKVLMLASLKDYKGIPEFISLAQRAVEFEFTLVLNASSQQVDRYFSDQKIPSNVKLVTSQSNVHPYYLETDFVLNLSRPDQWLETFGMTILEAMVYGKPVIVPPEGGVTELNENGTTGFEINCRKINDIYLSLQYLASPLTYACFSKACKSRALAFSPAMFSQKIIQVFKSKE